MTLREYFRLEQSRVHLSNVVEGGPVATKSSSRANESISWNRRILWEHGIITPPADGN